MMRSNPPTLAFLLVLALTALVPGCGDHGHAHDGDAHHHDGDAHHLDGDGNHDDGDGHHEDDEGGHGHAHTAPHGGALVTLGDHVGHVEVLVDAAAGRLTLWILDGEAEQAMRVAHPTLELAVEAEGRGTLTLVLDPVESTLTGETRGDCSEFSVTREDLRGLERFDAVLKAITLRGMAFEAVPIAYPDGDH